MKTISKKKQAQDIQRMVFNPTPQTPIPQPYFTIPSPSPYQFPLSQIFLQGVKLIQHYQPQDINQAIKNNVPQRMIRYKDNSCIMFKDGNGLFVNNCYRNIKVASAYCYGPNYLMIAFCDLRLQIYSLEFQLIKIIKDFSQKRVTFIKILSVPKGYQNIIILTSQERKLYVHRIQHSFFSKLSVKLTKQIIKFLQFPVTQIVQIPNTFKYYLRNDYNYKDCSLVCVSAVNVIYILKVNHLRLATEDFITIDHERRNNEIKVNSVSWGEARIDAPSRFINGDKLVLTYAFGSQVFFLALREVGQEVGGRTGIRCEWVLSQALKVDEGVVAFCQFMKKSQIFLITQNNLVIIFHTKQFSIFEKAMSTSQLRKYQEQFNARLQGRVIGRVINKKQPKTISESRDQSKLTDVQQQILRQTPIVTYADTFSYEYPSKQIYFLTQRKFERYQYCDWKIIVNFMSVQQKYQNAMLFLIKIHKKVNIFELGVSGCQNEISDTIHILAIQYINKKLSNVKNAPDIMKRLTEQQDYFKMVITPMEFLVETDQFNFLFQIAKDKIIQALSVNNSNQSRKLAQSYFYQGLYKFIQHGKIKMIPQQQLQITLKYLQKNGKHQMIDRLAIFFDLNLIQKNILIKCLLDNDLVVSLAHVCTQGNQNQFLTPFIKMWSFSNDRQLRGKQQQARQFAHKALWYVQLCLQRNWALKQYSPQKYAQMIRALSRQVLDQNHITWLLKIQTQYCLETLAFYFSIQNCEIISETDKKQLRLQKVQVSNWIKHQEGHQHLQLLLSAIEHYLRVAIQEDNKRKSNKKKDEFALLQMFLSTIIIYKTVKFNDQKYYQILTSLIQNYQILKKFRYGLQQKTIQHFIDQYSRETQQNIDKILASRYINKILTLVYYQCPNYIKSKFQLLLEKATSAKLTELRAEICFFLKWYSQCMNIYKCIQGYSQNLIYQFLQNSFKKLILQKKNKDKKQLAQSITHNIIWIVELNPQKTISIIQNYIQEIQDNLIEALSNKQTLQLKFLQGIINDQKLVQMKLKLNQFSILRYVQLMAIHNKKQLLASLEKNPKFTSESTLRVCEQYRVYDCMQYLYERMGRIAASVKIAALRMDELLNQRRNNIASDLDDPQVSGVYVSIRQILDKVIGVCKKNHSQQIWQSLLDSCIQLYQKYQHLGLPEQQIQVFFYINGIVMENLASNCPIQHTIYLLQHKYRDLNMGGRMSHAFTNVLADLSHSINIFYIVNTLIKASLQDYMMKDYQLALRCYSTGLVCQTCDFQIIRREKSIHFRCGHVYHLDCIINKEIVICVTCLKRQTEQFDYYLNTLNPQHPKIQKVNDIFEKVEQKKFQMREIFKVEDYDKINQKQNNPMNTIFMKRKNKLVAFDQHIFKIQSGSRKILADLSL